MIEFRISQTLARDLSMHLQPSRPAVAYGLQFYAHRVTVARRKCVIVMELQSRYAMVFCGLTKKEFEHFPEIFQERLWREVLSICEPENEDDMAFMSDLVLGLSSEQFYQPGSHRSVQAHIGQVAEQLAWMVNNGIYKLPVSSSEAFGFGLDVNEVPRTIRGKHESFQPFVVFRNFWKDLLVYARKDATDDKPVPLVLPGDFAVMMAARKDPPGGAVADNVIQVDFVKKKRR